MARRKSPYGNWKRIQLKYREHDPRYAGLDELIQSLPAGERSSRLLELIFVGLSAQTQRVLTSPAASLSPSANDTPAVVQASALYSEGAASIFAQEWD